MDESGIKDTAGFVCFLAFLSDLCFQVVPAPEFLTMKPAMR